MPTISAEIIKKPRIERFCGNYPCQKILPLRIPVMRIYGSAELYDPPYVLYICMKCASKSDDLKIVNALKANNAPKTTPVGHCLRTTGQRRRHTKHAAFTKR